jgi:hypothetical protein
VSDFGRRAPRFEQKLDVSIGVFDVRRRCRTTNVSRYGIHLDADPGVAIGKMVWLHIELPTEGGTRMVEATAVVRPGPEGREGAGLEFSMFLRGSRRLWEDHIRSLEGDRGEKRRGWPRRDVSFLVRLGQDGEQVTTDDISGGGLRIATDLSISLGTEADLLLIHPYTEKSFEVRARVVRHIHEDDRLCGLGLEFVGITEEVREDLMDFSMTGELPTGPVQELSGDEE